LGEIGGEGVVDLEGKRFVGRRGGEIGQGKKTILLSAEAKRERGPSQAARKKRQLSKQNAGSGIFRRHFQSFNHGNLERGESV